MGSKQNKNKLHWNRIIGALILITLIFVAFTIWYSLWAITCEPSPFNFNYATHQHFALPPKANRTTIKINSNAKGIQSMGYTHKYNFTVGICAIIRDSEAYLSEWLDYHLSAMEFDGVFLYDDSKNFDLQRWYNNTRNHPIYKKVEVIHWRDTSMKKQKRANTDCIFRYGRNVNEKAAKKNEDTQYLDVVGRTLNKGDGMDYFALIDDDEFLVPQNNYSSVHGVIQDYLEPYGGSLTVNWMLFGSANKTLFSPIPVTKRFQYRDSKAHGVVKSIVKASDFLMMKNPHAVAASQLPRTTLFKGSLLNGNGKGSGASDNQPSSGALLLYHYRYTSDKEYWYRKCKRGDTDGLKGCSRKTGLVLTVDEMKDLKRPTHIASRPGIVFDDSAWRLLSERVPRYRMFDDEGWGDYS